MAWSSHQDVIEDGDWHGATASSAILGDPGHRLGTTRRQVMPSVSLCDMPHPHADMAVPRGPCILLSAAHSAGSGHSLKRPRGGQGRGRVTPASRPWAHRPHGTETTGESAQELLGALLDSITWQLFNQLCRRARPGKAGSGQAGQRRTTTVPSPSVGKTEQLVPKSPGPHLQCPTHLPAHGY